VLDAANSFFISAYCSDGTCVLGYRHVRAISLTVGNLLAWICWRLGQLFRREAVTSLIYAPPPVQLFDPTLHPRAGQY
jgi:hypothetical protein